jgi:hypothetical protein
MSVEANAEEVVPLVPEGDSLVYEEELLRNPYSLKLWLRYLEVSNFSDEFCKPVDRRYPCKYRFESCTSLAQLRYP